MPLIRPFKGIVYNSKKIKDQTKVVSPPYDVIPKRLQDELYRSSPYNVVRLILNRDEDRYTQAGKIFESWLKGHVLLQDKKDSIYIYSQQYRNNKRLIKRIGFIGLMELSTGKKRTVLPHENTLAAPKLDRLNLMRSVPANLEPIFVLYEDKTHKVLNTLKKGCSRARPFIDITIDGIRHRVWRLDGDKAIKAVQDVMRPKDIFIADGHHRYEVAVKYYTEVQDRDVPEELKTNAKYMMAYFVELNDTMLTVLPTHRLIKDMGDLREEDIKARLSKFFRIEKASGLNLLLSKMAAQKNSTVFGMYLGKNVFYILKLKDITVSDKLIGDSSREWKRLDVTILHLFLLEHVLAIRDDEDNVEFVKDAEEAARSVDSGKFEVAFFLNPTKVAQVERIARLGERMPRKATYFYPKPLSGLVINKL